MYKENNNIIEHEVSENNNKNTFLWIIAIVNILTLVLLIVFFAMSWDVINADDESQEALQTKPDINQQLSDNKPTLNREEEECMQECLQKGTNPPECLEECGIKP